MIITVVTPSYNQGSFLAETIESVIAQQGDFAVDYIVVDGGSTDDSAEIIKRYDLLLRSGGRNAACNSLSYRWIIAEDDGQADAIMKGFMLAEGDILAWLNSDDTYLPGALSRITDYFSRHQDVALVYGDANFCDRDGNLLGKYRTKEFSLDSLTYHNMICQPAAFFSRKAFTAVGGLDRSLQFAMDFDLWARIGKKFSCQYVPISLATYRLHDRSKSIRGDMSIQNAHEILLIAMKHFGWAPLNRVYNLCRNECAVKFPIIRRISHWLFVVLTIFHAIYHSILINKGFNIKDASLFTVDNYKKLFKNSLDISVLPLNTGVKAKR